MARQLDVLVTVFHAMTFGDLKFPQIAETLSDFLRMKLDQFPGPVENVPAIRRELAHGPAAQSIVRMTSRMERPLIMMPTRGHTRFRQLLLGSVTAAVLHDAECPVWTEAHMEDPPEQTGDHQTLVCAVDMGPQTTGVLRAAHEFSIQFRAALLVVHSVPGVDPRFTSGIAQRAHRFLIDQALEQFPVYRRTAGSLPGGSGLLDLPLEIVEEIGLADGILAAAARHNADLLIIGRGAIQGPLGRLRTIAHDLIRHSHCGVLSV
jgi:nucleotide-binding universal stress UspA family protein